MTPRPRLVSPEELAAEAPEERETLEKLFELMRTVAQGYLPYMLEEQLFECPETHQALAGTGIACPPTREYLPALIRYATERDLTDTRL